jgi:hypothetical protein
VDDDTHFPYVEDAIAPVLENGTAIELCQIAAAKLNVNVPQASYLLGLGCNGVVYYNLQPDAHWSLAVNYTPLDGAPTAGIQSISSIGGGSPVFLTTSGDIWVTGRGTMEYINGSSYYVPLPAFKAPPIVSDTGEPLGIESSGGLFVLTDAGDGTCRAPAETTCRGDEDRIYKLNVSANTWEHFADGSLPFYPSDRSRPRQKRNGVRVQPRCDLHGW